MFIHVFWLTNGFCSFLILNTMIVHVFYGIHSLVTNFYIGFCHHSCYPSPIAEISIVAYPPSSKTGKFMTADRKSSKASSLWLDLNRSGFPQRSHGSNFGKIIRVPVSMVFYIKTYQNPWGEQQIWRRNTKKPGGNPLRKPLDLSGRSLLPVESCPSSPPDGERFDRIFGATEKLSSWRAVAIDRKSGGPLHTAWFGITTSVSMVWFWDIRPGKSGETQWVSQNEMYKCLGPGNSPVKRFWECQKGWSHSTSTQCTLESWPLS